MSARRRAAAPPQANAAATPASPRRRIVVVLGPGLGPADETPAEATESRVLRTDAGVLLEAVVLAEAHDASRGFVVARAWRAGRGDAPGLLFAEADACVFIPDPHDALGVRNRRAFRATVEALGRAGRDPRETCLFVADDRAVVRRGYAADPRRPVRTMLRANDYVAAARAAAAFLEPECAPARARRSAGLRPGKLGDAALAALLIALAAVSAYFAT